MKLLAPAGSIVARLKGFARHDQNVLMSHAGPYTSLDARKKLSAGFERGRRIGFTFET